MEQYSKKIISNEYSRGNTTITTSDIFLVTAIVAVLIAAITYIIYLVGGDWKKVLILSILSSVLISLLIYCIGLFAARYSQPKHIPYPDVKNISNEKDLYGAYKQRILAETLVGKARGDSQFLLFWAYYGRWPLFLIFLWGTVYSLYMKDIGRPFYFDCFMAILWFPLFNKLVFRKLDFFKVFGIKFVISFVAACALLLFQFIKSF